MVLSKESQLKYRYPKTRNDYLEYRAVSLLARKFAPRESSVIHKPQPEITETLESIYKSHFTLSESQLLYSKYRSVMMLAIGELKCAFIASDKPITLSYASASVLIFNKYLQNDAYKLNIPYLQLLANVPYNITIYRKAAELYLQYAMYVQHMIARFTHIYCKVVMHDIAVIPFHRLKFYAEQHNKLLINIGNMITHLRNMPDLSNKPPANKCSIIAKIILYYMPLIKFRSFPVDLYNYIEFIMKDVMVRASSPIGKINHAAELVEKLHIIWTELHEHMNTIKKSYGTTNIVLIHRSRAYVGVLTPLILRLIYDIKQHSFSSSSAGIAM